MRKCRFLRQFQNGNRVFAAHRWKILQTPRPNLNSAILQSRIYLRPPRAEDGAMKQFFNRSGIRFRELKTCKGGELNIKLDYLIMGSWATIAADFERPKVLKATKRQEYGYRANCYSDPSA